MLTTLLKFFFILVIPIFLHAQAEQTIKLIKTPHQLEKDTKKIDNKQNSNTTTPNISNIKKLNNQDIDNTNNQNEKNEVEQQIEAQNKILKNIIENINTEKYITEPLNKENYNKKIDLLENKINLNKRYNNDLAIKRDQLKVIFLKQEIAFNSTLKNISLAKREFKDSKYFQKIISNNITSLEKQTLESYSKLYDKENISKKKTSLGTNFIQNYIEVYNQTNIQLFILKYLRDNMEKYRKATALDFIINEFNLQYFINKIDKTNVISTLSTFTSYYLNFSIGEVVIVLLILLCFKFLNKYAISLFTSLIAKIFIRDHFEDSKELRESLRNSIKLPMRYALILLSLQLSFFILVKDITLIEKVIPWVNTTYMALFTWAIYMLFDNIISLYAQNLLEKYPNVRTEMIVFILRMVKIILFLIVVLFLFTQLGIDIKAIAASLGVGGIAIALALKDTLANFFGSLNIMTDNSFSQGDWIKTSDVEGTVVDIRMRTTRIRTFDNAMITVPNSKLAGSHIVNWSKRIIGRRIKMSIGITYESKMEDIKQLKEDIFQMLKNHPDIATVKETKSTKKRKFESIKREDIKGVKNTLLVFIDEYDSSSINILVYCFSRSPVWQDWLSVKEDVIIKISQLVEKNNCEFAYPTQTLMLKNEEEARLNQEKE